jgi:cysteinyl-tRNA synthetase
MHRAEALFKERKTQVPAGIQFENISSRFVAAIEDDFNSAEVMAIFHDIAKKTNLMHKDVLDKTGEGFDANELAKYYSSLRTVGGVLGLLNREPAEYFRAAKARHLAEVGMTEAQVADLIHARNEARKTKNFAVADTIRKTFMEKRIEIEDTRDGSEWWVRR